MRGSPGGSSHEKLESELVKSLTRKDKRVESQSIGTEKKILIPSQFAMWADKPHDTVSKVVLQRLDSTSTKELEGGFLQAVGSDTNLRRPRFAIMY